jgi:hypothetical protein
VTATIFYDNINEVALAANTFTSAGTPADPTAVSCVITDPGNTAVTHTYGGTAPADIVKVGTGKYTLAIPCSPAVAGSDGLWGFEWIGTGAVSDVQPGTWRVFPANISQLWYIGLEEFKDRLGITDAADDYQAQIAIQAVSQAINGWCGRHFNQVTETRTYMPHNIWLLDIDDLVAVTSFAMDIDGDGIFETAMVKDVDYQLRYGNNLYNRNVTGTARPYRQAQIIQTGKWFPFTWPYTHLDRISITGTWGWPAVPSPVTQACFLMASEYFKLKDAPFGTSGGTEFGTGMIRSTRWVRDMLTPFVNGRTKVGVLAVQAHKEQS